MSCDLQPGPWQFSYCSNAYSCQPREFLPRLSLYLEESLSRITNINTNTNTHTYSIPPPHIRITMDTISATRQLSASFKALLEPVKRSASDIASWAKAALKVATTAKEVAQLRQDVNGHADLIIFTLFWLLIGTLLLLLGGGWIKNRLKEHKTAITAAQKSMESAAAAISEAQKGLKAANDALKRLNTDTGASKQQLGVVTGRLGQLENAGVAETERVTSVSEQLGGLSGRLAQLEEDDGLAARVSALENADTTDLMRAVAREELKKVLSAQEAAPEQEGVEAVPKPVVGYGNLSKKNAKKAAKIREGYRAAAQQAQSSGSAQEGVGGGDRSAA